MSSSEVTSAATPPTILHEQEGLIIRRNSKNQFTVVTLHHTANPLKRGDEWRLEAGAGMSKSKFAREYDIDYGAGWGERVFPEIISHREAIVIRPPAYPSFPTSQVFYGGFDYGLRNPSSFHVYTTYDQITYVVWELYEPCRNIIEFCGKMKACPYYERLRWIAADPHIADLRFYGKDGNAMSVLEQFREQGIRRLIKSSNSEEAWLTIMRRMWANPEDPKFKIFDCCPAMIQEFTSAIYAGKPLINETLGGQKLREGIEDVNNHAMDDCKYYFLSLPRVPEHQRVAIEFPTMVSKYTK